MPIPSHKNPITVLKRFRDDLTTRTGINNFTRDGKARSLSDTLTEELIAMREEQVSIEYANQLSNASGRALEEIGERVGVIKIRAAHANVDFTEKVVALYVESGTFGSINGAANISIPNTITVSSEPNSNELNTSVVYQVTQPFTLLAGESLQYISLRATTLGSASNVGTGVLRIHNFTNYVDSANNTLKVINFYPILNGIDDEPDDLYRFRIANHYNRQIQNNETRMKLTALDIPGIINTRVEPGYFGIGTAGIFALGPENQANGRLIESLQQRLDGWQLPAGSYTAVPATEVFFDFEIEVSPTRALSPNQVVRLKSEINKGFLSYFRSLTLGAVVDLNLLATTVQRRVNTIASFSQQGGDKIFKKVYIRKGFAAGSTDEKARVVSTVYTLKRDEFASLGTMSIEVI